MDKKINSGPPSAVVASVADLRRLVEGFHQQGFAVIGPSVRDHAICYETIHSFDDLPAGYSESQRPGHYRLTRDDNPAFFAHAVGPMTWKRFLSPPDQHAASATLQGDSLTFATPGSAEPPGQVFFGMRACDVAALRILDTVFLAGPFVDAAYQARRRNTLIVAVNCTRAGDTCFCASMGTGPRVSAPYDLALTECVESDHHSFLIETGSQRGQEVIAALSLPEASEEQQRRALDAVAHASRDMGRHVPTAHLPAELMQHIDDYRWDKIADRCLTCGNCTMVCPTCFCSTYEDSSALGGMEASRHRRWDSCFSVDFSYIHGGSIRASARSRFRQWLMHKLAYWPEQFGTFGCVGCGRCVTWCPAGIDITEEVNNFLEKVTR